ncbi:glycoside hydrolase family 28 protein [Thalassotalea castellviae]|uniref:Glycoside hydrolase family 28 protein n=1 Tax=Thalassotalea castellviae TaxID=3075612 RepID=A0ABU2ZX63_9GAMM|nr:glycoside hydrolase family 28 protein [Thalassotalea sp. W431]MDT0602509.1 glycoside hydrolase family 28 protein [Thalassotalea sp. W431]
MKNFLLKSTISNILILNIFLSISVHANNDISKNIQKSASKNDWAMMDNIIANIQLPNIKSQAFTISDFGATPGGEKDARSAILATIAYAVKQGGGKVVIPQGVWLTNGPIVLQSGINLHLAKGATLLFSANAEDYLPVVKKRWEGTEMFGYSPMIYANNVEDVAITGKGVIDGNTNSDFHTWYKKQQPDMLALRTMGIKGVPVENRQFGKGHFLRPELIQLFGAKRVLLEGYTAKNSPFWVNHLVYTDHATVRDIRVDSHRGNNDGIDIESSTYVLVENSHFRTGDDAVVVKSGRDKDGRDIAKPSKYIVVRNNDMGGEDGIALGSEMSGGISHVYFTDNILRNGKAAIRFKGSLDRGGLVEHIRVRNMTIAEFDDIFWFQLNYPGVIEGGHPSIYRDIVFENITVEKAKRIVFEAHAYKDFPIEDIILKDVTIKEAKQTFILDHVKNLVFDNVSINNKVINKTYNQH